MKRRTLLRTIGAIPVVLGSPRPFPEVVERPPEYVNGERVGPRLTAKTVARPLTAAESLAEVKRRGSHPPGWQPDCACYWKD